MTTRRLTKYRIGLTRANGPALPAIEVHDRKDSSFQTMMVGLAGLILAVGLAGMVIDTQGGASGLLRVPANSPELVAYLEDLLGPVVYAPEEGHDGHQYFKLANDPLLLHPEEHARFLDRPVYRAQRMLYPLLASGLGILGPEEVWSLIVVNVIALAVGTWATSTIGVSLGGTPWLGLFFVLNPGLICELAIDGGSVVGFSLAAWALVEIDRARWNRAAILLALAVLARESLVLIAAGAFIYTWLVRKQPLWRILLVPGKRAVLGGVGAHPSKWSTGQHASV